MKKMRVLPLLVVVSVLTAQWKDLTLEDVFKDSPFELASIGQWQWFPETDDYLFSMMDATIQKISLYKYNVDTGDTTLFISGDKFIYNGEILQLVDYTINVKSNKILLVTAQMQIWRHSRSAIYYVYDMISGSVSQVAKGNRLRNVKFSPNGKSIAYLKNDNNLYVFHIDSNNEIRLTKDGSFNILNGHFGWVYEEEFGSFDAYRWSLDSKFIAFIQEDQTYVKKFPMIDELEYYPEIKWHHYPKVGEKNPILNIGIANVYTKRIKWLDLSASEEMYYPRINWLENHQIEDGDQNLVVTRINRHQNRLELLRFNVKKGKGEVFWTDESDAWVDLTDDLYSLTRDNFFLNDDIFYLKDGSFIALSERSGYRHIYHYNPNGILINAVTSGDWEVSGITTIDEKNETIYFMGKKDSVIELNLYTVKIDGSGFKLLSDKLGSHHVRFSPTNSYYIDFYSTTANPLEITLHKSDGSKVRDIAITDKTQFEEYGFQETTFFQIPATDDGTLLNAMITLPRDFDSNKKYPVIVYGYSGPGSQTVVKRPSRYFWWDKYMNQKGYITFSIDPRGTGGRGKDFKHLAYGDIGKWVVHDQVEGAKYLKSLPYVDGDRIGIWGWSGGGYMTAMCMTKGAPHFKVGVAVAPVTDFRLYDTIWTERYMGLLSENEAGYKSASVLTYADKLQGKLLLVHGTGDDNVHPQNSIQLMDEFVKVDKHADILLYANRDHGILGGNTTFHLWSKITSYFTENL